MMRKWIDFVAGRRFLQPIFEWFYTAGVYGMNYGNNGLFSSSGELANARSIRKALELHNTSFILFDVGANSGKYAVELAKVFEGSDYKVHAFEPSKVIFDTLCATVAGNPRIIPVHHGLSENAATQTLYKRSPMSGLSSVYNRRLEHFNMDMPIREEINLIALDDYCNSKHIHHIHFLKMDIEGHELSCLKGASRMLSQQAIDFIQFEFGGCNIDSRTYFQDFWYLLKEDYQLYRIVKNGLVLIQNYNERLEIFKNVNFLAVRKSGKFHIKS